MVWHEIAAVVSELPGDAELTEQDATEHLDVLTALLAGGPVLPVRFGTTAPDRAAVRDELLAAGYDELLSTLDNLDGLVELRVAISFAEQDMLRDVLAEDPALRTMAQDRNAGLDDRVQLGEAVAEAVVTRCHSRGEQLMAPLTDTATAARRFGTNLDADPYTDRWALLVPAANVSEVDTQVAALRAAAPETSVSYVGPLPVFTFLEELTAPPQEPANRWGW